MSLILKPKKDDSAAVPVAFRAPPSLVDRLDEHAKEAGYSRSQALQTLFDLGLELEERLEPHATAIAKLMENERASLAEVIVMLVGKGLKAK